MKRKLKNSAFNVQIITICYFSSREVYRIFIKNLTTYQREEFFDWISVLKIVFLNLFFVGRRFLLF